MMDELSRQRRHASEQEAQGQGTIAAIDKTLHRFRIECLQLLQRRMTPGLSRAQQLEERAENHTQLGERLAPITAIVHPALSGTEQLEERGIVCAGNARMMRICELPAVSKGLWRSLLDPGPILVDCRSAGILLRWDRCTAGLRIRRSVAVATAW